MAAALECAAWSGVGVMYFEVRGTRNGTTRSIIKNSAVIAVATARMMQRDGFVVTVIDEDGAERGFDELDQLLQFKLRSRNVEVPQTNIASTPRLEEPPVEKIPSEPFKPPLLHKVAASLARYGRGFGIH